MRRLIITGSLFLIVSVFASSVDDKSNLYVKQVEKYLNEITTFESDFVQSDKYGEKSFGHFFLKRPCLMKMDYRNPPTHVIIVKDNKVTHYDRELNEKTVTSIYSSPLSFFLERKIELQKNLKILSIYDDEDILSIKFCKKDEEVEGAIALVFSKNPLALQKWIIFSNKNDSSLFGNTEISLINSKCGHFISSKEFEKFM